MEYRPRIYKKGRKRISQLLPMEYRPSEIAKELGVHYRTVRRWCTAAGAPHRRDKYGHIWIVGTELAVWMERILNKKPVRLADGEGYCVKCKRAVAMVGPLSRKPHIYAFMVKGTCPICGNTVCRMKRD